jgi:hypothetical protein
VDSLRVLAGLSVEREAVVEVAELDQPALVALVAMAARRRRLRV